MEDTRNENVDGIYCLGDLVNFAGWDNEVIHLIRDHNIPCVQGNHDEGIGWNKESFSFSFSNKAKDLIAGSVGKPKHGDNRACYVTMEVNENSTLDNSESFHVHFHYLKYDVEKIIRKIKEKVYQMPMVNF